ncbi:MAG: Gfo/Idh/MocA family oxidoreductase [Desertimonas sp.]
MSALRVGVVGAGIMGANHARVARTTPGLELVAVVDADIDRARSAAGGVALALSALSELPPLDLAVVAVPTLHHVAVADHLVERGVPLLVEKPLAATAAEARALTGRAAEAGVLLGVGHVERFNPAVIELGRVIDEPLHLRASRIGPYSARIGDGVIHDLMIHDLDIVMSLVGDVEVVAVSGVARHHHGGTEDLAVANVEFANGVTATFETSRLGQEKIRVIEVTQADSVIVADLVRQDLLVRQMSRSEYLSDDGVRYRQSSVIEIPFLETRGEPLMLELRHMADCVQLSQPPLVGGAEGTRAIELADRIAAEVRRVRRP